MPPLEAVRENITCSQVLAQVQPVLCNIVQELTKALSFVGKIRPLIVSQENKLMMAAPWGPHP